MAVELLSVAFEEGSVGGVKVGLIPDGFPCRLNGRNMIAMFEDRIGLRRDAQPRKLRRLSRELSDLHTADIFIVAGIIEVTHHTIGDLTDLVLEVPEVRKKAVPL